MEPIFCYPTTGNKQCSSFTAKKAEAGSQPVVNKWTLLLYFLLMLLPLLFSLF